MEFDDITKMAALIGTSLKKVDQNTVNAQTTGPANKIDIRKFVKIKGAPAGAPVRLPPQIQPAGPTQIADPGDPLGPVPLPELGPPPRMEAPSPMAPTFRSTFRPIAPSAPDQFELLVRHLGSIAESLSKINKKLVSVQKYYNMKNGKYVDNNHNPISDK